MITSYLSSRFGRMIVTILTITLYAVTSDQAFSANDGLNPDKRLTQYIVDSWTTDRGLPNNGILDLEKTRDGYMWIGTYTQLARFDGTVFREFPEMFNVNGITAIHEDHEGYLWISSNDGKLIKMKDDEFTFIDIDESIGNSVISAIDEDHDGVLWFATRSGLVKYNNGEFNKINHPILSKAIIYCLEIDALNNLWIGTSGQGLFKHTAGKIRQFTESDGLISNSVRSIHVDNTGKLWVGTEGGLTQFEYDQVVKSYNTQNGLPHNYVNVIMSDSRGSLWIGTDNGLVRRLNDQFEILDQNTGMTDNTIQAMIEDESGVLWIGTYYGGLNRLKDGKFVNYGALEGLNDEVVNVVQSDEFKIWIGSNSGINYIENGKVYSAVLGNNDNINKIRDIHRDSRGLLWIGTSEGLIQYDDRVIRQVTISDGLTNNRVRRIFEDDAGHLWIGTAKGLNRFNPTNNSIKTYGAEDGLSNEFIMSIHQHSEGAIWVGTNGGGVYELVDGKFKAYTKNHGLGSNIIFDVTEDKEGNLWTSSNAGFARFNGQDFQNITRYHGIPTHNIFQTLITDRYFWLFSDKGLIQIKSDDVDKLLDGKIDSIRDIRLFNKSEGMRADQITGASVSDIHENGEILVSTQKGLSILNPARLSRSDVSVQVKITDLISDGKELDLKNSIEFEAGTRNHEFHYTGLNFYAPERVEFRYRLRDFDDKWTDAGTRHVAYYSYIPPGDYVFEVIATNSDGVWGDESAQIAFTQSAYFYETYWFYGIMLFILIVGVYSANYARLKLLKIRNKQLGELVKARTEDIQNQNQELEKLNHIKDKLFSLISHDLRGPVNSCVSLLELMNTGDISEKEFKSLTKVLSLQIEDVKDLLNDLLDWSKSQLEGLKANPEKISLKAIVFENFKLFEVQASHKQLTLKNDLNSSEYVMADLNMAKVIVRNLISNAIKFSNQGGVIEVSGQRLNGEFEFSIHDNGVGISKEDQDKIFAKQIYTTIGTSNEKGTGLGLMLVREFAERNGGEVSVTSDLGKGSTFKFTLPMAP